MSNPQKTQRGQIFGAGVSENDLLRAIKKSGYPLQTLIARQLSKTMHVQEEWSYIDRDTHEQRTIDLLAWTPLCDWTAAKLQPRVRPTLNLLIECKQSDLPYVFFLSESKPRLHAFPSIAGLAGDKLAVTSDDDSSTWNYGVLHALGLNTHAFLSTPVYSSTFSKCVRKGQELVLSGSESYNGLVLPLLKSVLYFQHAERPPKTAIYFDAHLCIGLGVLDAPMVGVTVDEKSPSVTAIRWIRVTRHESLESADQSERTKLRALDVVHKKFLPEYLKRHLMPYAKDFACLVLKHQLPISDCAAFVSGMGKGSRSNIEARLQPKRAPTTRRRFRPLS